MSQNINTHGKKRFECSCGQRVNLDQYEIVDWMTRHAAINPTIEHKLSPLNDITQEDYQDKLVSVLDQISKRMANK